MKKCPFCGADIADNARFCLYCMHSLEEKELILLRKKRNVPWSAIVAAAIAVSLMLLFFLPDQLPEDTAPSESRQLDATSSAPPVTETSTPPVTETTVPPTTETTAPPTTETTAPPVTETTVPPTTETTAPPVTETHIHNYTVKNTAHEYLKSEGICTTPSVYYYSCSCGEKGMSTFSWGGKANHIPVTIPGYPADCINAGLTDHVYCSVCSITISAKKEIPAGHIFPIGASPAACLTCGETTTMTIHHQAFPYFMTDDLCILGGTYKILTGTTQAANVEISINYTYTSGETLILAMDINTHDGYIVFEIDPTQSGTLQARFYIANLNGTYTLHLSDQL